MPVLRIPLAGAPPLSGWALRLVSGVEEDEEIKPGFWMSKWYEGRENAEFAFEPELHMVFNDEAEALRVSDFLLREAEIATQVVRIGLAS